MSYSRRKQQGAALVVALILLVVATLIGLASSRNTVLQERMASNSYDRSMAFQRSEAALRFAEAQINATWQIATLGGRDCSSIACPVVPANAFTGTDALWLDVAADFDVNDARAPGNPQYHIAFMGTGAAEAALGAGNAAGGNYGGANPPDTVAYYRITARSSNPDSTVLAGRSLVVLQSTMRRPF
jgi:type IV pilus assembly protein PilX